MRVVELVNTTVLSEVEQHTPSLKTAWRKLTDDVPIRVTPYPVTTSPGHVISLRKSIVMRTSEKWQPSGGMLRAGS